MSDSILYLAIVAIWAGFLIPAWVRRPHAAKVDEESELAEYEAEVSADAEAGADVLSEAGSGVYSAAPTMTGDIGSEAPVNVHNGNTEYRDDVHTHNYDQTDARAGGALGSVQPGAEAGAASPGRGPSQSREQMMRARRRMLTILAGLVFITGLFVAAGMVQWWICVPPIAMLVLYVLLLREIAMADAELAAKKRAWEARQAAARAREVGFEAGAGVDQADAGQSGWKRSHLVWEAEQPGAEIIDISSRVGDQLYDQYADAAVRAVGD